MPDLTTPLLVEGKSAGASVASMIRGSAGGGDATKYLDGAGALSTPAGGGASGFVQISSGSVSTPVEFLDFTLPDDYSLFSFVFFGLTISSEDGFGVAVSRDGGNSFDCDADNADTYFFTFAMGRAAPVSNSLCGLGGNLSGTTVPSILNASVLPGGDGTFPLISYRSDTWDEVLPGPITDGGTGSLNPTAVVPPTAGRATTLRFMPFGRGDANPPTSGEHITAGAWIFLGVPTP